MEVEKTKISGVTHPRSILNLSEASVWHLLIDETGTTFSNSALELAPCNHQVGRVVGLLHPEHKKLPSLFGGFHATDLTPFEVHQVLNTLLDETQVGILGVTVQLDELEGRTWMNAVYLLIRWVLALLPASGQPVMLKVFIEQRSKYVQGTDLRALSDTLCAEMRALSPQRLGKLRLEFNVISKAGHPHNGYVDSLAYVWGSPKSANKRYIEQTELLGRCLIESDSNVIERLFLNVQHQHKLMASDWYEIAGIAPQKLVQTLLEESLEVIRAECQQDLQRWTHYLDYCCSLQLQKNYHPQPLYHATQWLATAAPADLNSLQLLKLKNTQLAAANHLGQVQVELAREVSELAKALFEEDAQLACRTVLRVIVMHCNAFNFERAHDEARVMLDLVAKLPSAAVGKKNIGKLQSSYGQVLSFLQAANAANSAKTASSAKAASSAKTANSENTAEQAANAGEYFQKAINTFATLHDPNEARLEITQTKHYQCIWLMDQPEVDERSVCELLYEIFEVKSEVGLRTKALELARNDNQDRFAHYLLLRACRACPAALKQVERAYWSAKSQWQTGRGHPWQLITFYRALLIWEQQRTHAPNSTNEEVQQHTEQLLAEAIRLCRDVGHAGALFAMAECFESILQQVKSSKPNELSSAAIMRQISHKLPHSFH